MGVHKTINSQFLEFLHIRENQILIWNHIDDKPYSRQEF